MCRPAPPDPAEGIIASLRGSAREKYNPWGAGHEGELRGGGIPPGAMPGGWRPLALAEGGHDLAGKPAELFLELLGPHALGPVDHHLVEARVGVLEVANALDDVLGRPAQPRSLLDAVADTGNARGRARRAPRAPVGVRVAHEAEWREPLVALDVIRFHAPVGLLRLIGARDLIEDLLAVERHHTLDPALGDVRQRLPGGDGLPDLHRPVD